MSQDKWKLDTIALHAGHEPDAVTLSRAVPIYLTTSYAFKNAEHAANLFALKEFGNIYTRLTNPTTEALEKRLGALHGVPGAVAVASGMSAIFYTIANITSAGENFVTGTKLYGGTYTLFTSQFPRFGIEARFTDLRDPAKIESLIDEKTKLIFTEAIGNPACNIDDMRAIANVARAHKIPLVIDNTTSPPPIFDPFEYGADIVLYSLTKIIGGHGAVLGGAIVENPKFDWKSAGKFPTITEPDKSYHGVNFWGAFGGHDKALAPGMAFTLKIRAGLLRDIGAALSPFNAHQVILGLETLPLRARRHLENAQKVAEFLENHPNVTWVNYAGLKSHPDYERARKMFPLGPGAIFGFGVKGGYEKAKETIDKVRLATHLANVLDAKTLVIHSASTTHQQLTDSERKAAGVPNDMVRISVGLEDPRDITADLDQALA